MGRMDTKDIFKQAFSQLGGNFSCPDHETAFNDVLERAKNMKKDDNVKQMQFTEITPEYIEPKKSHKAISVVAGIAGAAAVLTGAVFGLNWLNEHGGLKGPDVSGPGAGYSANADATAAYANDNECTTIFQSYSINGSGYVNVDQRYGVGDDITVHLKGYKFDGTWAKIYYDVIYKDEIMGGEIKQIAPKETENGHTESLEYAINANYAYCTANYRLDTPADSVNVSFGYKDDQQSDIFSLTMQKNTDMIDEPIATTAVYVTTPPVEATTATTVLPDSSDADTTTSYEAELKELNRLKDYYEHELEAYETAKEATAIEIAKFSQRKEALASELTRLQSLGEDTGTVEQELKGVEESIDKQKIMLETYSSECEQTYDKLGAVKLEITKIEAEMKKHIFFEFGGDETEVTAETTVIMNIPDDASRNGYYEGEEALDILKQYAGEDYCFPLENWTKDVINYRTRDEWTVDTSTDYRFNIPAEEGESILAVTGGTVIETNPENVPGQGEGIYITIQAADGRKWRYSHLSDIYVSEGDIVKAGSRIAAVGATGWCTGPLVCISFPDSEVIDPAVTTE